VKNKLELQSVPSEREYATGMVLTTIVMLVLAIAIAVGVTWFTTRNHPPEIHSQALRTATLLPLVIVPLCAGIVGLQGFFNHRRMLAFSELAHTDEMTELANRRAFMQRARNLFEETDLNYSGLCVFIIDLDHFKRVNDAYGHDAGDEVLIHASRQIAEAVPPDSIVARLGGEEFAVLMPYATSAQIHDRAEAVRYLVAARPCAYQDQLIRVSASVGVGIAHPRDSISTVMARADNALYEAKNDGRNRFVIAA